MSFPIGRPRLAALLGVAGLSAALAVAPACAQTPPFTLDQALAAAGAGAPAAEAASAGVDAARAERDAAGLRPNPVLQAQIENIAGSGAYSGLRSAETSVGVNLPVELGGKRGARVAVADARVSRAELQSAVAAADIRLRITELYIDAVAAGRRAEIARDQLRIAGDALDVARRRVQAGRASPIEEQRADVARVNAQANVERSQRVEATARVNLARRIAVAVPAALDGAWLDSTPTTTPVPATAAEDTLTLAVADADLGVAEAGVRLARANRSPDLTLGPAIRRLEQTNDTVAVFSLSVPLPVFNSGRGGLAQAAAERSRAAAQRRLTAQDVDQAIADAKTEAANAAVSARAAAGPALAAAQEAARIARIGYREGKFGQLELLDAERTLAATRTAALDALVAYRTAVARLERLTTPAPRRGITP